MSLYLLQWERSIGDGNTKQLLKYSWYISPLTFSSVLELTPFSPTFFLVAVTYARVQFRWLSASASILIRVIRCQWMPYVRDTSTFFTTNCFIHGLLLTGLSNFLVSNYKDMKLWRFIVLIKCTCLHADTTWHKHVRVMWNWSEHIPPCHCRKCYQVIIITVYCNAALQHY